MATSNKKMKQKDVKVKTAAMKREDWIASMLPAARKEVDINPIRSSVGEGNTNINQGALDKELRARAADRKVQNKAKADFGAMYDKEQGARQLADSSFQTAAIEGATKKKKKKRIAVEGALPTTDLTLPAVAPTPGANKTLLGQ